MPVTDLLAARRPHRADARRNFDALLVAARETFAEQGPDASLEEVARRAGVGSATLHRNFPSREDLIECVYIDEVETLCRYADELTELDPWDALNAWLNQYVTYLGTKRVLVTALNRGSTRLKGCLDAMYGTGGPLLSRAQEAGVVRDDVSIDDVLRLVNAITAVSFPDEAQQERVLGVALDGIKKQVPSTRV